MERKWTKKELKEYFLGMAIEDARRAHDHLKSAVELATDPDDPSIGNSRRLRAHFRKIRALLAKVSN